MQRENQLAQLKRVGQGWMREAAAQQKVMRGRVAQQQATRQTADEQEANGKRGARGQEVTGPRGVLRSGGRVERTRGGGINTTTSRRTRDFCCSGKSDGDDDGHGDGKCRVQP